MYIFTGVYRSESLVPFIRSIVEISQTEDWNRIRSACIRLKALLVGWVARGKAALSKSGTFSVLSRHKPRPLKEEEMVEISIIIVDSDRIPDKSR